MKHLRLRTLATLAALGLMLALTATQALASGTQVLSIHADSNMVLRYNTGHLRAHHGRIEIVMHNPSNSGMDHGIAISGHGVKKVGKIVAPGHSSSVTVTLARGTYTFYCPVPGHEQAGMKGTLTVS